MPSITIFIGPRLLGRESEPSLPVPLRGGGPTHKTRFERIHDGARKDRMRNNVSEPQAEHLNAGTACPGSTSTELKSPQRPHCRLIFIGSLMIGVVTCASA